MSEDTKSLRDSIRSKVFSGCKNFTREKVLVNGMELEVKKPSVREAHDIKRLLDTKKMEEAVAHSIIMLTYVPGTEERVFEAGDLEMFTTSAFDAPWKPLEEAIAKVMQVDREALGNDSGPTVNAS